MRRATVVLICLPLVLPLALTACSDESGESPPAATTRARAIDEPTEPAEATRSIADARFEMAPPVTLDLDGEQVDLQAWTSCYRNGCADGFPPPVPYDVGDRDEVRFTYPLQDWRFSALFREVTDGRCGRSFSAPLTRTGAGSWTITPAGYAGTYDVDVSGRGDGDVQTTFRWTTRNDGNLPKPFASLNPVHDGKGAIDHFGVSLYVRDLADLRDPPSATLEVTAANGHRRLLEPRMAHVGDGEVCTTSGYAGFDYDGKDGRELAKIGKAPYTYVVRLALDGTVHTASVVWPGPDADPGGGSLRLTFDPPLPALE